MKFIGQVIGGFFAILLFAILVGLAMILLVIGVSVAIVVTPVLFVADYVINSRRRW